MRIIFENLIYISFVMVVLSCESEVQNQIDPEMEMNTITSDSIIVSVNGEAKEMLRYNAIKRAESYIAYNLDLFISESDNSERFEMYYGIFHPAQGALFHFQKCNYIDDMGVYYTNGCLLEYSDLFASIPEKSPDRFVGNYQGVLYNSSGDSVTIDSVKVDVPFVPKIGDSEASLTLRNNTINDVYHALIMIKGDTLRYSGFGLLEGENFNLSIKLPSNILTGTYSTEDLPFFKFEYTFLNQGMLTSNSGILSISKFDYFTREVIGNFETEVVFDGNDETLKLDFAFRNF